MLETIAEYVAGLGLAAAKNHFSGRLDEKKLRDALTSYIERQQKYNKLCTLVEEIDFQGLVEYVNNDLIEKASTRIFAPSPKKRGQARQEIVDAAVLYSKAKTHESKLKVEKAIVICLDIIREFYHGQLSVTDYIITSDIVDAVSEVVQTSEKMTVAAINDAKNEIITRYDREGSLFSLDKAVALTESGEVATVESGIRKVLDHISINHPYYPDFGYDYRDGKMVSKPLTAEVKKLYPPKIILTGTVRFGNRYYNDANGNPLDYAYRHQISAVMEVTKAVKLLGSKTDPIQDETVGLIGQTVIVEPPHFPPAFPCSIKVGKQTFFDYVLLRTQEIEDDGTYVIGNREQGGVLYFEVKIKPNKPSKSDFKITLTHGSNKEHIKYLQFMSAISKEKDLHVYALSANEDIIAGFINNIDLKTGFISIDEEIDFLERICAIEEYFNVTLTPDGEITQKEYDAVIRISDLVRNVEVKGTWSEFTVTCVRNHASRENLTLIGEKMRVFSSVWTNHVELFGAEFEFRSMRTFRCAQIADYKKLRRKLDVLDDGDKIKITFRAGEDKEFVDTLKIPEHCRTTT